MNHTSWVIKVLDDSDKRNVEYENRRWLEQNVEKMKITVLEERPIASIFDVASVRKNNEAILIQEGKKVEFYNMRLGMQALLLISYDDKKDFKYLVFKYSPKQ